MAISDKMYDAAIAKRETRNMIDYREIIQEAVNAAWTDFNPEKISEIELDKPYLIMHQYGISDARLEDWYGDISWHNDEGIEFADVTHYANPNDLLYVQNSEVKK